MHLTLNTLAFVLVFFAAYTTALGIVTFFTPKTTKFKDGFPQFIASLWLGAAVCHFMFVWNG